MFRFIFCSRVDLLEARTLDLATINHMSFVYLCVCGLMAFSDEWHAVQLSAVANDSLANHHRPFRQMLAGSFENLICGKGGGVMCGCDFLIHI